MTIPQFTAGQVLTAAELNAMVDAINAGGGKMEVQQFTANGTFTVPAGVTFATAHIRAGGGGAGRTGQGAGGNSSVAFAGGTITALGGNPMNNNNNFNSLVTAAGRDNSGQGAKSFYSVNDQSSVLAAQDGSEIVAGAAVTPAATIAIVVGAGGVTGTSGAPGGSGYVWIEYTV